MKNEREMSNALSMAKTLEDLKKSKKISNTEGRPVSWLTDELWQKEFSTVGFLLTPPRIKSFLAAEVEFAQMMLWRQYLGRHLGRIITSLSMM